MPIPDAMLPEDHADYETGRELAREDDFLRWFTGGNAEQEARLRAMLDAYDAWPGY